MKVLFKTLTLCGLAFVSAHFGYAQEDSLKHYIFEGTIVTATRSKTHTVKTGRSVSVISENDIRNSAYHTVGELLERQEGIYMIGTKQTQGSIQNIFMRGANSNHTVIMIDGMRLSDPSSVDNALDISELTLANIERIEIVRGAHSTLYGSSAIGGAVNIITKKNDRPGLNADADFQTGYFGGGTSELSQNAYINYTFGNGFYFNTEVFHSTTNGINAAADTSEPVFGKFDRDGFRKLDLMGRIGYSNEKLDLYTTFKTVDQKSDLDRGAYVDDPNYAIDFERLSAGYGASYQWNDLLTFDFFGGYSSTLRTAINDSNILDAAGNSDHNYFRGDYEGTLSNNEFQSTLKLNGVEMVAGAGVNKETMSARTFILYTDPSFPYSITTDLDPLNIQSTIYNAYLHSTVSGNLIHKGLSRFSVGIGGRLNHHTAYGNNYTYDINPVYGITDRSLIFASFATGFNAPSLYRLYTPDTYYTSDIQRGNKNLKPEASVSYELGYKRSGDRIRFSLSVFYTKVKDYIDYVYLWDKNIPIDELGTDFMRDDYRGDTYLNIGDQINRGVDAAVSVRMNPKLMLFANVSLTKGKLNYVPADIDEAQTQGNHVQLYSNGAFLTQKVKSTVLIRRPNTGNIGLTYDPIKELSLTADAQYTGARRDAFYDQTLGPFGALGSTPLTSYWYINTSANYVINKQWYINLKIENLLDEKSTEIRGFRNRGRGVLLCFRYILKP